MSTLDPTVSATDVLLDEARLDKLSRRLRNPWLLRGFLLAKLPLGLFAGLRVDELDAQSCTTSLPYGWRTTNPFRSIYFAAQVFEAFRYRKQIETR